LAFFACGVLKIHPEPDRPYEETYDSGSHVLRDLPAFFSRKGADPLVVGLGLRNDLITGHVLIYLLDNGCEFWRPTSTSTEYNRR
jgi:hypothetical protein